MSLIHRLAYYLIAFAFLVQLLTGTIITVNPLSGSDVPTCSTILSPCRTIGYAMSYRVNANGDVISLNPGTYTGPSNTNISFVKSVTITSSNGDPNSVIIDCQLQSATRAFVVNGTLSHTTTIIRDITIRNCKHSFGGAIAIGGGAGVSLVNVIFSSCQATANCGPAGGAIHVDTTITTSHPVVNITNCSFLSNSVSTNCTNPSISASAYGGAVYVSQGVALRDLYLNNCVFDNNTVLAEHTVSKPTEAAGGAVFAAGQGVTQISNCTFTNNWAKAGTYSSLIDSNGSLYATGGAIELRRSSIVTQLTGSVFTNNAVGFTAMANTELSSSLKPPLAGGGAIHLETSSTSFVLNISSCSFISNTAAISLPASISSRYHACGGALWIEGDLTATNAVFTSNSATAVVEYNGISRQRVAAQGGAVCIGNAPSATPLYPANGYFSASTFTSNSAVLTVLNSVNSADSAEGGAIAVELNGQLIVTGNTNFSNNYATAYLNATYVASRSGTLFKSARGGAIYFEPTSQATSARYLTIGPSTFTNNSALCDSCDAHGGAVFVLWTPASKSSIITVADATFQSNSATVTVQGQARGGAWSMESTAVTAFNRVKFLNNKATSPTSPMGGAVMFNDTSSSIQSPITATLTNCTFEGNTVSNPGTYNSYPAGGAIAWIGAFNGVGSVILTSTTLRSNNVSSTAAVAAYGGAFFMCSFGSLTMQSVWMENNIVKGAVASTGDTSATGGAIFIASQTNGVTASNLTLIDNAVDNNNPSLLVRQSAIGGGMAIGTTPSVSVCGAAGGLPPISVSVSGSLLSRNRAMSNFGIGSALGGAVAVQSIFTAGSIVFSYTTMSDNSATGTYETRGGTMYANTMSYATLSLANSTLTNSSIIALGPVLKPSPGDKTRYTGGAIALVGVNMAITNSSLTNCSSPQTGGAISANASSLTLTDTVLSQHNASYYGGAIYADERSTVNATNTIARQCRATQGDGGGVYAAYFSTVVFARCNLTDHVATGAGGAVYVTGSKVLLSATIVKNNTAGLDGGGLTARGGSTVYFLNSVFQSNVAARSGGGAACIDSKAGISGNSTIFSDNRAVGGAGLFLVKTDATISGQFTANTALKNGGAILAAVGDIAITTSSFNSNTGVYGGAIQLQSATATVSTSNFTNNNASINGGAMSIMADSAVVSTNCRVINNRDSAVFLSSSSLTISDSTYTDNVGSTGGCVMATTSTLTVQRSSMSKNLATDDGGAIFTDSTSTVTITNSTVQNNTATDNGGGVFCKSSALSISGASLSYNTAGWGGALSATSTLITVSLSTITGNSASNDGGGIALVSLPNDALIDRCQFISNRAESGSGGAVYLGSSTAGQVYTNISSANFSTNYAGEYGGAVFSGKGNLAALVASSVAGNQAVLGGGGIYHEATSGLPETSSVVFAANTAGYGPNKATAAASFVVITPVPSSVYPGQYFNTTTLSMLDAFGQTVTTQQGLVSVATNGSSNGYVEGTASVTVVNGIAVFSNNSFYLVGSLSGTVYLYFYIGSVQTPPFTISLWDRCPAGQGFSQYPSNAPGICEACTPGTASPLGLECSSCMQGTYASTVGAERCQVCPPGAVATNEGSERCDPCLAGTYSLPNRTACQPCPLGHFASNSMAGNCTPCAPGLVAQQEGATRCTTCQPGTAPTPDAHGCVVCPKGTYSQRGFAECTACPPGFIAPYNTSAVCVPCDAGYYSANTTHCQICPTGFFAERKGTAECSLCPEGYWNNGTTPNSCFACPAGSRSMDNRTGCEICPIGTYSRRASGECTPCPAGEIAVQPNSTSCTRCSVGTEASADRTTCVGCLAGSYSNGTHCVPCNPGYISDEAAITCRQCRPGEKSNSNQTACEPCPAGWYSGAAASQCLPCPPGSISTEAGSPSCTPCPAGTHSDANGTLCTECQEGYYSPGNTSTCMPCENGYYASQQGAASCWPCPAGSYSLANHTACELCEPGTYAPTSNHSSCLPCQLGTYASDSGSTSCIQCARGYVSNIDFTDCDQCPPGFYSNHDPTCLPCQPGHFSGAHASQCIPCAAGTYSALNGTTCLECAAGTRSSAGSAECVDCDPGTYSGSGSASCTACPLGTISNANHTACITCPEGTYSTGGADTCTPCPDGFVAVRNGSSQCTACPAGQIATPTHTSCVLCEKGTYSIAASTVCLPCNASLGLVSESSGLSSCRQCDPGSFSNGGIRCDPCAPGYFSAGTSDQCQLCEPGSIAPIQGMDRCTPCDAGKYSDDNRTECLQCPPGYFSKTGSYNCTRCPSGLYAPSYGSTGCSRCPQGQMPNEDRTGCVTCEAGSASPTGQACIPCSLGEYSFAGAANCSKCPAGYWAFANGTGCLPCPNGYYSLEGSTECTPCDDGYISSNPPDAMCTACPPGTSGSADHTACIRCTAGSMSVGATLSCTICPAGYKSLEAASECTECEPGSYSAANSSTCTQCLPGFYAPLPKATECLPCAEGNVSTTNGATSCSVCDPGSYALPDRTGCKKCAPGYYSNGKTPCAVCPPGTWSTEGASECIPCDAGTYSNASGTILCSKCPPGSSTDDAIGAVECTPCEPGYFTNAPGSASCSPCSEGSYNPYLNATECIRCPPGTHAAEKGSTNCTICRPGTISAEGQKDCSQCPTNRFDSGNHTVCLTCPKGGDCSTGSLKTSNGYWRKSESSTKFYKCPNPDACVYNKNTLRCAEGYTGILCGNCAPNYGKLGSKCSKCPSVVVNWIAMVAAGIVLVGVTAYFVYRARGQHSFSSTVLKILLNHLQMLAFIGDFRTNGGTGESLLLKYFNFSSLSMVSFNFLPVDCTMRLNAFQRFAVYMSLPILAFIGPFLIAAVYFLYRQIRSRLRKDKDVITTQSSKLLSKWAEAVSTQVKKKQFTWGEALANTGVAAIVILYLIYPTLANQTFNMFNCVEVEGQVVLARDVSLHCYDRTYYSWLPAIIVGVVVYTLGIPIAFFFVLYRRRHRLDEETMRKRFQFLYASYKLDRYWWEIPIIARKLALVCITVYVSSLAMQTFAGLWVIQASLIGQIVFKPFDVPLANKLETMSLTMGYMTLISRLGFGANMTTANEQALAAVVIISNFAVLCVIVLILLAQTAAGKKVISYVAKGLQGSSSSKSESTPSDADTVQAYTCADTDNEAIELLSPTAKSAPIGADQELLLPSQTS